jgi:hypothetical protein
MIFPFLTPQLFDALVIGVVLIGGAFAAIRLYRDLARPMPPFGAAPSDDVSRPPSGTPPAHLPSSQETP